MDTSLHGFGLAHDPRTWILLFRFTEAQERALHDIHQYGFNCCGIFPGVNSTVIFLLPCLTSVPQWFFWGYSLTFSDTASRYIGDLSVFHMSLSPYSAPFISTV